MTWTVTWSPSAENDLAALWLQATNRKAVTTAADRIDQILRTDPYAHSESRAGSDRVMLASPLGVGFSVSDADRLVTVWAVWQFGTSPDRFDGANGT